MSKFLPLVLVISVFDLAETPQMTAWKFAVSGDSRDCGGIVMPAIAKAVRNTGAHFYWHLGDFRAIYKVDEDMVPTDTPQLNAPQISMDAYLKKAWPDFIERQLRPFGSLELFLGIGNHETILPKSREAYLKQFGRYLNSPGLRAQRQRDDVADRTVHTYYHWIVAGSADFISLDNATNNAFDDAQLVWLRARLAEDQRSSSITTVVVGMHEALPGSKGLSHSMCDSRDGVRSGREVYQLLLALQQGGKNVYVLASHSHFVLDDVYNTPYWNGQVLPGWIVGTAGAVRYRLPPGTTGSTIAKTDVYGFLLGELRTDGTVQFEFKELSLADLRLANTAKVPDALVRWCYTDNTNQQIPEPAMCANDGTE